MVEPLGLALGVLGVAGLFKSCIDNFDIVVRAKNFGEDFDLLCTQLALQRLRLVLWGESLGLVASPQGDNTPYNIGLDRPDIKVVIEPSLDHLRRLLERASVVTDRFALSNAVDSSPGSMSLFRDRFDAFRRRMHANQKQNSVWKTTRWAVHDAAAFKATVDQIKQLVDGLESITGTMENLLRRQRAALVGEIESVPDTRSLRLIQMASGSSNDRDASTRLISDVASHQLSLVKSSSRPSFSRIVGSGSLYHTTPLYPRAQLQRASDRPMFVAYQPKMAIF
ncbi:hypothetical protein MCOR27_010961 [Pyricularia oryzae]|uniref:Prion-inhibition and propagation HeLo domain-containing protein n=2 Tax=Pyricularia TaxID=48558 RepID=A0ABQ8NZB7_PYRGI|nr:hypothetical protein MCOR01_001392 [Pyricularia oryzae]KAI6304275.1 hypothetical protein MCOR33_000790 [Pyricularia grisea]KAH9430063.1 hypothetical protein MCOR02_009785 [Pyricularia oryzae]KAI6257045.1 hypothetical protein MCOR19_006554 [Pyricularia oryzae]KAI6266599.1 hypothetical protein MCOR27_010961 [Pyricularia oryzae]